MAHSLNKVVFRRINTKIGASCMLIMLEAIWPSLKTYPNALPASAGITSNMMIAYFVFWLSKFIYVRFYRYDETNVSSQFNSLFS